MKTWTRNFGIVAGMIALGSTAFAGEVHLGGDNSARMASAYLDGDRNSDLSKLPPFDQISLRNLTYNGSGCPFGSLSGTYTLDSFLGFDWDEGAVELGAGVPRSESRKFCQLTVGLDIPDGWSYAVSLVEANGYAALSSDAYAEISTDYYFQGQLNNARSKLTLRGPFDDDFTVSNRADVNSLAWSPCGGDRSLNIKTSIRVGGRRGASGYLYLDQLDSPLSQKFMVYWKRC